MVKRIIAVMAGMCMVFGSPLVPTNNISGIPVQEEVLEPITPVPVKDEYHTEFETQDNTVGEGSGSAREEAPPDSGTDGSVPDGSEEHEDSVDGSGETDVREEAIGGSSEPEYLGNWCITAYCGCAECNGQWADGRTAYGEIPTAGHTVACNTLPAYTQVLIGDTVYTVEDTGYTPYGDAWIDIYFDTHEEAEAWGVQYLDVYIVR